MPRRPRGLVTSEQARGSRSGRSHESVIKAAAAWDYPWAWREIMSVRLRIGQASRLVLACCVAAAACGRDDTGAGAHGAEGSIGGMVAGGAGAVASDAAGTGGVGSAAAGASPGAPTGLAGAGAGGSTGAGGAGGASGVGAGADAGGLDPAGGSGGSAAPTFVEDEGEDCEAIVLPDAASLPQLDTLPDPFEKLDATRISTKAEWRCRRHEIKRQAEQYVYGSKPPKPASVSGSVSDTSITVEVSDQGKSTSFSVSVELPGNGAGPYPAIVGLGGGFLGFPLDTSLVEAEGVATITYDPYAVGSESASRGNKAGAFYDLYGSDSSTGLLVAWSWGVSRIIDVLEQAGDEILKADAIGVSGCSRFGKGAFTIGAFDQRIALTLPIESGSAGVPIWRGLGDEGAQSPSSAYGETYWLGDAFGAFTGDVTRLPIDTHEIVAMVAPRGLFIMDNPHIANLGPRSAHVAALAGAEVYEALGAGDSIGYVSSVADGAHCAKRPEWAEPLRASIRRFLTRVGSDPAVISAASGATGDLAAWRDWTTPALD
jgi:hypothetical protein